MNNWIRLHEKDHVIIALRGYAKGERLAGLNPSEDTVIELQDDVRKGHKIITKAVRRGEDVLKFGSSIGRAKQDLSRQLGAHA